MKADGIGNRNADVRVEAMHWLRPIKKIETKSSANSSISNSANELTVNIDQVEQIVENVSKKLEEMSRLLEKIGSEKNDIIRQQLIRFFNVLRAYIDEALHPSGDWPTHQLISGKTVKIKAGTIGESVILHGEMIDAAKIGKLSELPTSEDIETAQLCIGKSQAGVKKILHNIALARAHILHQSNKSSAIIL